MEEENPEYPRRQRAETERVHGHGWRTNPSSWHLSDRAAVGGPWHANRVAVPLLRPQEDLLRGICCRHCTSRDALAWRAATRVVGPECPETGHVVVIDRPRLVLENFWVANVALSFFYQLVSNYGLIRFESFVSQFSTQLCN
jgi:hypothetical protein